MSSRLTGYADKFAVQPGEKIKFMVSTGASSFEVGIVRLLQADENVDGPGYKEELIDADVNGAHPGRKQEIFPGSWVQISDSETLDLVRGFTLQAWIYPTMPHKNGEQGLISKWSDAEKEGYGMCVGAAGDLEVWLGNEEIGVERVGSGKALIPHQWYFVAVTFDADSKSICLYQVPVIRRGARYHPELSSDSPALAPTKPDESFRPVPTHLSEQVVDDNPLALQATSVCIERHTKLNGAGATKVPLLLAAVRSEIQSSGRVVVHGCYNGKLEGPSIFGRALTSEEVEQLHSNVRPHVVAGDALVASWDFSRKLGTSMVEDIGPDGLHGSAKNMPARGMTGHNWIGDKFDPRYAPREYGAIYFHEDDLEDAGWETDFEWVVPNELRSGVFAARLTTVEHEDHIPFFVRPKFGQATAPIAFLAPTFTYLAYANDWMETLSLHQSGITDRQISPGSLDVFLTEHPEFGRSLYNHHNDGMRCIYSSRQRPIVNMRPKYRYWLTGAPRHLSADLYLISWLEEKGFPYDVITDEDLHHEGKDILESYNVIITGSHPEYWTAPMMAGMEDYLDNGGRTMYLGGNGMYWVTGVDSERPHVIEVRRSISGFLEREGAPGEGHLSTTGEPGGLWRGRGKGPNRLVGIGFTAMGWAKNEPGYTRKPDSFDSRAEFIFAGIGPEEVIGDFGLVLGGAAGDELDRVDGDLGTPSHALLLASSGPHSQDMFPVLEDLTEVSASLITGNDPNVRADMVYFETPEDGAVFSVGSINWMGSLLHNGCDNNVSRVTENVLRRFMD